MELLEKNVKSKMDTLEYQINKLTKIVTEKDTLISSCGKQFKEINVKLEKQHIKLLNCKLKLKSLRN